ncbi:MAG: SUMF1/EgtB/PvdO family nonheme iron enzyme [Bacteroidia bacterium]|nr:SUMF1/EgtB/PvdO family nonheme iron enzyme [Bacteroidia bacterium]
MAYKWSEQKFDNIAVLKRNFEKKYLTDYLKLDCYNDISQGVVDQMNTNYLVSLLTLYNHYEESEDDRLMDVGYIINRIADRNQLQDQVSAVLKGKPDYTVSLVVDDPRTLEKDFVKVNDTLYAGKTEVTNAMYELFLTDMLKQKRFDDLDEARSNAVDWRAYLPLEKKALSDEEIFPHGKPTSDHFPVVNISHHAAELYCQWLTAVYNGLDHKRKKHVKVEFRLPTEQEWEFLAQGGDTGRVYPWGGPYVRNSKGCFIANLKTASSQGNNLDCASNNVSDADGGYFPVRADSYFPNAYGLFNMTGNVAEMVSETSLCKGGGWNTKPSKAKIKSKNEMTGPSPEIGFRVIMVIQ